MSPALTLARYAGEPIVGMRQSTTLNERPIAAHSYPRFDA